MKTLKLLVIIMALFVTGTLQAQVAVNVNVGAPPMWGPAGYSGVQYYYLPDVYSYYHVPSSMFIYQSGGAWVHRAKLPAQYRHYDLYKGYKVVMTDYHGNTPYVHYKEHKMKYAKGYKGPLQKNIGVKPGKDNPKGNSQFRNKSYKASDYSKGKSDGQRSGKQKGNNHGSGNGNKK